MSRINRIGTALVVILIGAGCGGDGGSTTQQTDGGGGGNSGTTTAQPAASTTVGSVGSGSGASADVGECTITLTGDRNDTFTFPQSQFSLSTDYWMTDDDLQGVLDFLDDESGDTLEDYVARGEPVLAWLLLNCVDPDDLQYGLLVANTNDNTNDDFPMGPGTFPVSGGLFSADGPTGTVIASLGLGEEIYGTVEGSGELVISRWDRDRLEGTVTFHATEAFSEGDPLEVDVRMVFDYRCAVWHSICR